MDDVAFYSTAAQVIPVLLLALIFERRGDLVQSEFERLLSGWLRDADEDQRATLEKLLREKPLPSGGPSGPAEVIPREILEAVQRQARRSRALAALLSAIALLVLVAGESLALKVTVSGRATEWTEWGVGGAIVVGFALILWPLLLTYVERMATVAPWLRGHTYVAAWTLLGAIFILSAAWW